MAATRKPRPRGRPTKPGLNRDLVLSTAIRLADEEGIEAASLRRVADALGVHPTSIYNHVPNKEAIFEGMIEALLVEADLPMDVPDWASWVREFAAAIRRTARAHPGAFGVFLRHVATGPIALRHIEAALDAFCRAGCSLEQAGQAVHGTSLAVLGLALEEVPVVTATVPPDFALMTPEEHPLIFELEGVGGTMGPSEETWNLMVESMIAGFAATLPFTKPKREPKPVRR